MATPLSATAPTQMSRLMISCSSANESVGAIVLSFPALRFACDALWLCLGLRCSPDWRIPTRRLFCNSAVFQPQHAMQFCKSPPTTHGKPSFRESHDFLLLPLSTLAGQQLWLQCHAVALGRVSFGGSLRSAQRVHWMDVLITWQVCLCAAVIRRVCSAERGKLNGRACHLADMRAVLRGFACAAVLALCCLLRSALELSWQACVCSWAGTFRRARDLGLKLRFGLRVGK